MMEKGGDSFRFEFPPRVSKKKKEEQEATEAEADKAESKEAAKEKPAD